MISLGSFGGPAMRSMTFAMAAALIAAAASQAYPGRALPFPARPFKGSVEIPVIHAALNLRGSDVRYLRARLNLYSDPRPDSRITARIRDWRQIQSIEHGYEQVSAVVYEVRRNTGGQWYRVQFEVDGRAGTAWLSPRDAGRFRVLYDLLHGSMAYLTPAWNGRLSKFPGARESDVIGARLPGQPEVRVADAGWVGQDMWLLIIVLKGSTCSGNIEDKSPVAAGWVPAFNKTGEVTVWFYARGC